MGQCAMSPACSGATASRSGEPAPTESSSRSASTLVANTASGYHLLKIDDYSRSKGVFPTSTPLKSRPFTIGGHQWRIRYYPNGYSQDCDDYISLVLQLDEEVDKDVCAQHKFRWFDESDDKPSSPSLMASVEVNKFSSQISWGRPKFIKREEFERSRHLKKDSFTIRCDVVVIAEFAAEDKAEATVTHPKGSFVTVPPSDLHQHLGDLLHDEKGADVLFKVGGKTFNAHRYVLAARSPVFRAELFGSMKESRRKAVIHIDDMEAQVFKALLCFVYTDLLPEMEKKYEGVMYQHLLVAGDRYGMERLKLVCEDKLCKHIDVSMVATILTLAEQHHCDGLKKACIGFLCSPENLKSAMAVDGFDHLSRSCPPLMTELVAKLGSLVQCQTVHVSKLRK